MNFKHLLCVYDLSLYVLLPSTHDLSYSHCFKIQHPLTVKVYHSLSYNCNKIMSQYYDSDHSGQAVRGMHGL